MIDTVKIFAEINENIYNSIRNNSIIKRSFNAGTGELYYDIINDSLKGSFDGSLSVKVSDSNKYMMKSGHIIEIEGSYHKFTQGQNAYAGFYNLQDIVKGFINIVDNNYNIKLPSIENFFRVRVDIAKCFNLLENVKVQKYINNFRFLKYPRRKLKHYENESIYISGTTSTLKIYNKLKEFKKNDRNKLKNFNTFDLDKFENIIDGFVRFEIEIKKRKLEDIFKSKVLKCIDIRYEDLEKVWCDEFMKLFKLIDCDLKIVNKKEDVKKRLYDYYKNGQASILYAFYIELVTDGYELVRSCTSKSSFYRKIGQLKKAGVDFSSKIYDLVQKDNCISFNIFDLKEVA